MFILEGHETKDFAMNLFFKSSSTKKDNAERTYFFKHILTEKEADCFIVCLHCHMMIFAMI